jgi:hypothetical protein
MVRETAQPHNNVFAVTPQDGGVDQGSSPDASDQKVCASECEWHCSHPRTALSHDEEQHAPCDRTL